MPVLAVDGDGHARADRHGRRRDQRRRHDPEGKPGAAVGGACAIRVEQMAALHQVAARCRRAARRTQRPVLGTDTRDQRRRRARSCCASPRALRAGREPSERTRASAGPTSSHARCGRPRVDTTSTLVRGCIITGKVVDRGRQARTRRRDRDHSTTVASSGRAAACSPDGTFRWTTTEPGTVAIRAWPWQPPAVARARLRLPRRQALHGHHADAAGAQPDIAGTLVDAHGTPVPLAYLDVAPLDVDVHGPAGARRRRGPLERVRDARRAATRSRPPRPAAASCARR